MCGKEFANAYTELNDPFEQRLRFEEQVGYRRHVPRNFVDRYLYRSGRRNRVMKKPKE